MKIANFHGDLAVVDQSTTMAEQEPVVQAEPTMDTKVAALPSEDDATTRVLKRGDLVRVAER